MSPTPSPGHSKDRYKSQRSGRNRRINFLVNERFQWRYTSYLVITVTLATLLTGGVTAYFLNQNYGIFTRLAYLHAPDLLPQLEREQIWINTFLVAFFITLVSFNFFYGLKMTSRIAGPIVVLKRHIRSLSRGMFSSPGLRVRESDEFRDLIEAYNYLFKALQAQIRRDVKCITEAMDYSDPKKTRETLVKLLDEKKAQLAVPETNPSVTSAPIEPSHASRHVS